MVRHSWAVLGVALTIAGAAGASAQPAGDPSAQQNVRASQQYESLLRSNSGFRNQRLQKECGPIDDPQLHASCVASFQADSAAPSLPPHSPRNQ